LVVGQTFEGRDVGSAIFCTDRLQLTTALPSTSTVQHPHWPDGEQPSLGEQTPSSSRNAARQMRMRVGDGGIER